MSMLLILAPCIASTILSWHAGAWPALGCLSLCYAAASVRAFRDDGQFQWAVVPLVALIVVGTLQAALGTSVNVNSTIQASLTWGAWAGLFVAAATALREQSRLMLTLRALGVLAAGVALVALCMPTASRLGIAGVVSMAPDFMVGPFPNRNIYACFCELSLPVTVWLALRTKNWLWWAASIAIITSVLTTGSRAGAGIILGEVAVVSVLAGTRRAALILGGCTLAALATASSTLWLRLTYDNPLGIREEIAASAWHLIQERPLLGWGLGTFSQAYPRFAGFDAGSAVNHAHNDWLEWAVEGGFPVLVAMAAFFAIGLRGVRKHWWGFGVAAVCVHAIVDYPMQRQGVALWLILLTAALIAARDAEAATQPSPTPRVIRQ
jgi:O-antigen ligase